MSGVEMLFLDGGATVFGLASAAGAALGYKQKKQDDSDFVSDASQLDILQTSLQVALTKVRTSHKAASNIWGAPLSLFEERSARRALSQGVQMWAVACVCKACGLADEASELGDLADVYNAQFELYQQGGGKGLLIKPVVDLSECLENLCLRLSAHLPFLEQAKAAFDISPSQTANEQEVDEKQLENCRAFLPRPGAGNFSENRQHLPICILSDRHRLGELWRLQGQTLGRVADRISSERDRLLTRVEERGVKYDEEEEKRKAEDLAWLLERNQELLDKSLRSSWTRWDMADDCDLSLLEEEQSHSHAEAQPAATEVSGAASSAASGSGADVAST